MNKGKIARLVGFAGALGVSAVLITTAVSSTGAYFTASQSGNLAGTSGHLEISSTGTGINFTGLNPGEDKTNSITYTVTSSSTTNADVWLVFDTTSDAYGKFTGAKNVAYGAYTEGGLGSYGHFKVSSDQGYGFESYNLQLFNAAAATSPFTSTNDQGSCTINANGTGGGTGKAVGTNSGSQTAPLCGVPAAIQLGSNIAPGAGGSTAVTFGLTGKATGQDTVWANVPFKIVATQPGVRPDASNF
jgi:hypothetical protein